MTTLENKIFTLKQNHLIKKMKEIHFLNNLILKLQYEIEHSVNP